MQTVQNVMMQTLAMSAKKIRQTSSTDASYPTRAILKAFDGDTDNQPAGIGDAVAQTTSAVFDLRKTPKVPNTNRIDSTPGPTYNLGKFQFFGTGADNTTMLARILGWHYITDSSGTRESAIWMPTILFEATCTLSTFVGIANGTITASDRFADTLVVVGTPGVANVTYSIHSPADNTPGYVVVDLVGCQKVEVIFGRNGSATACNGTVAFL